jgi:hypothetical protein
MTMVEKPGHTRHAEVLASAVPMVVAEADLTGVVDITNRNFVMSVMDRKIQIWREAICGG